MEEGTTITTNRYAPIVAGHDSTMVGQAPNTPNPIVNSLVFTTRPGQDARIAAITMSIGTPNALLANIIPALKIHIDNHLLITKSNIIN